ncbi:MAG: DNA-3-methyladenine glycosylase 2 family protein [Leptolyngbyaceae cyanobacterium MO_188.B28]|nr:DNA-3-methyladenine glycosylase 2 family protein [Leptolyngbyaceae cyanobacterium MO_188.B28]
MKLDHDICYRAIQTRDSRFDGRFFTGVLSTGIYCRPVCPAPLPKPENCQFFSSAAAAHAAGFRPCLRCRPEVAPELSFPLASASTVSRALSLIAAGGLDENSVSDLAAQVGVSDRHLRRLFTQHLGVSPMAIAQTRRIHFAKKLLDETSLSIADVALASGFSSLRRFNDVMRRTYHRTPRELRKGLSGGQGRDFSSGITLKLPFSPPYNWVELMRFFIPRAIPGIEMAESGYYRRTVVINGAHGVVEVRPMLNQSHLAATIQFPQVTALGQIVEGLRRLFDLGAKSADIDIHLQKSPYLSRSVAVLPGLRVAGAWDAFELAVRAILGQQVSVAAATTLAGRLVKRYGDPLVLLDGAVAPADLHFVFPAPAVLANAELTEIGLPRVRAQTISALAAALVKTPNWLQTFTDLDDAISGLRQIPGIGEWTAQYIAMRALHEPDAFPASDLGLLRAMGQHSKPMTQKQLLQIAEAWRPWRAYAAMHLWLGEPTLMSLKEDCA